MHLYWLMFVTALTAVCGQSDLPSTPLSLRGLWCQAQYSSQTQTYTQVGQVFFYNNGTFTYNYLNDPNSTWISHLVQINTPNGTNGTYQLYSVMTQGPSPYLNKTLCFWRQLASNGNILPGRGSNGTCSPTYEPDTSPDAVLFTRTPTTCKYVDDENPQVIISNTAFEVGSLLPYDRRLPTTKKKGVVFYGSSSISIWTTIPEDFPDYTALNRGFGGSVLPQAVEEFKRIVYPLEPSVFIIYCGDNDIPGKETPAEIQGKVHDLLTLARRFYPNIPIGYISIKPSPSRAAFLNKMNETNHLIQQDIESAFSGVTFINVVPFMLLPDGQPNPDLFGPDKLHMNRKGYLIWIREVTNYLASI